MSANPEHPVDRYRSRTAAEWAAVEAAEHDRHYRGAYPFGRNEFTFTVKQALEYEDYCYKKGRARWCHRTRKFLELLNVESLPGKALLDIGSGTGQLAVLYAMCGAQVTGIDLSSTGTEIARRTAAANGVAGRCRLNTKAAPTRLVLRVAKLLDDTGAALFPGLARSFGNAVLRIRT